MILSSVESHPTCAKGRPNPVTGRGSQSPLSESSNARSLGQRFLLTEQPDDGFSDCDNAISVSELMFPKSEHRDSLPSKRAFYNSRAAFIRVYFLEPILSVCLRQPKAKRASMPKAAIYEYRKLFLRKPEIRPPGHRSRVHSPSAQSGSGQRKPEADFGGTISFGANLGHQGAPSFF